MSGKGISGDLILGDIGGTYARLLRVPADFQDEAGELPAPALFELSNFKDAVALLGAFLESVPKEGPLAAIALCAAGPLEGEGWAASIHMTNTPWSLSAEAMGTRFGAPVLLLNDFTACVLGLPDLRPGDLEPIGDGVPEKGRPLAAMGPGTGLGTAALLPQGENWVALPGEGGQTSLCAVSEEERALLDHLSREGTGPGGHVAAEHILSGPGIVRLYKALAALAGAAAPLASAAEIAAAADKGDALAVHTLSCFSGWLGAMAGDLALTYWAAGGFYLAGGVLPKLGRHFDRALFRARFEAKGVFTPHLARMPVYLIKGQNPAFSGLARAARMGLAARSD